MYPQPTISLVGPRIKLTSGLFTNPLPARGGFGFRVLNSYSWLGSLEDQPPHDVKKGVDFLKFSMTHQDQVSPPFQCCAYDIKTE